MKLPDNIKKVRQRLKAKVHLDANESPFNTLYNRYPDATVVEKLKKEWGKYEHIPSSCIYFCNGTEEAVDLTMRAFALFNRDSVVAAVPTRTVYERRAAVNRLEYREASLRPSDFELQAESVLNVVSETTKIIYLCSPNSPTGNLLDRGELETILQLFDGYVVVDESYIDFAPQASVLELLNKYRNLIILRSFSHGWSLAGIRFAAIVAYPEVIETIERVGMAHSVGIATVNAVSDVVKHRLDVDKWVRQIIDERTKVRMALSDLKECKQIYHSDANFLFVRFADSAAIYRYLLKQGIAVHPVQGCLRISIGLPQENSALIGALRKR